MNPHSILALLLAASLALLAPFAAAHAPAPGRAAARHEVDFLEGMVDHHTMAVMTAEVCIDEAIHEELRALCEDIAATQSQEIATMEAWLSDWYGVDYEPVMSKGMMREVERLSSLDGADFEVEFMTMMIKHHEGAIREAEQCLDRAYHEDLLALCEGIIETQSAEIEMMQAWLCDWYALCRE